MLNEKTTTTVKGDDINAIADHHVNARIAALAEQALPATVLAAEMAPYAERVRSILGAINTLASDVARLQDEVCEEYRPSACDEARRWADLIDSIRGDLARILAGPKACDDELQCALDGLRDGDIRYWRALSRHVLALAHAEEVFRAGEGSFHTGDDGAVLSAIGDRSFALSTQRTAKRAREAQARIDRARKTSKRSRKVGGGK